MSKNEVEQLFGITSEIYQNKWSSKKNNGQSISSLEREWDRAKVMLRVYWNKGAFWLSLAILSCLIILIIFPILFKDQVNSIGRLWYTIILAVPVIPCLFLQICAEKNMRKQEKIIEHCENVFSNFSRSLAELDNSCVGSGKSIMIDYHYVSSKAHEHAVRVVDAQRKFDALKNNKDTGRSEMILAAKVLDQYEADLYIFEATLNENFGEVLDRTALFKNAEAYLDKASLKPAHAIVSS